MGQFQDIEITCFCGEKFVWKKEEQHFMNLLLTEGKLDTVDESTGAVVPGEVRTPKRCETHRKQKKARYASIDNK
jgi:hypothetical protein